MSLPSVNKVIINIIITLYLTSCRARSLIDTCSVCVFVCGGRAGGEGLRLEMGSFTSYCPCQLLSKSFMIISLCLSSHDFFTVNVSHIVMKQRANRRGPAVVGNKDDFTSCGQVILERAFTFSAILSCNPWPSFLTRHTTQDFFLGWATYVDSSSSPFLFLLSKQFTLF